MRARVVVLADTHIRRGARRRLPDTVYAALEDADAILHAGDVLIQELLDELSGFAPVSAVLGNNDHELILPGWRVLDLAGVRIGMIHDSGPRKGRAARVARRFPDCAAVVFGHSHVPCDEVGVAGQRLLNPGSPTERRTQVHPSFGLLDLDGGHISGWRVIEV